MREELIREIEIAKYYNCKSITLYGEVEQWHKDLATELNVSISEARTLSNGFHKRKRYATIYWTRNYNDKII